MVSRPILALRSHRRETGAEAEVLWSLCCSPAPLALQDPFWFCLRDDAMPYNTWLLRKGLIFFFFPRYQLFLNEFDLKLRILINSKRWTQAGTQTHLILAVLEVLVLL